VTSVLACHAASVIFNTDVAFWWGPLGRAGVVLFFVHTSYVLMGSLDRLGRDGLNGWARAKAFYIRRAWRIYPLAIATILLVVLVRMPDRAWAGHSYHPPDLGSLVANLSLTQNISDSPNVLIPLWSLPLEVQMYVVLPVLFTLVVQPRSLRGVVAVVLIAIAVFAVMKASSYRGWFFDLVSVVPCFLAGVSVATFRGKLRPVAPPWLGFLVLLALLAAYATGQSMILLPRALCDWLLAWLTAVLLISTDEASLSVLTRMAGTMATYSYGVYLLHVPAIWASRLVFPNRSSAAQLAVATAILVPSVWIAYWAIEQPGIRLGQRITRTRVSHAEVSATP
jgi:peptidoglycan/LPS O-acetylase OafA/YrhL